MNFVTPQNVCTDEVLGGYLDLDGDRYYQIANCHLMPEFFIMPVSASDHWMFASSRGAVTAGRRNPDTPLFPYYSADKISHMADHTGPKTLIRLGDGSGEIWEPFANSGDNKDTIARNIYKNVLGSRLCLEEVNLTRGLVFRSCWAFGHQYGFVRSSQLVNNGSTDVTVEILDGLENIMPDGLDRNFQLRYSNLGDAYKKNELLAESQLGLFYLSSIPTDRAEPSEALRSTVVWQYGLNQPTILISSIQVERFRSGHQVTQETDIRAHRGAYLVNSQLELPRGKPQSWTIVANTGCDQTDVANLRHQMHNLPDIDSIVKQDIRQNEEELKRIIASADGLQTGADLLRTHRHQSNVLFNVMRGGYPANAYQIKRHEFANHVEIINRLVYEQNLTFLDALPEELSIIELITRLGELKNLDLLRIGLEYLPFSFSRRHGDPSRPWNAFSIELLNPDGSKNQNYQGNWRDIFQNWEALSLSYPEYASSMIFRFVNASTADGYNPYRVTKEGIEWEAPDPADPWANIGYWGDHQIIYLLKLLEWSRGFRPDRLDHWLGMECCTYANVPYRIRSYEQTKHDPRNTIDFDFELEKEIKSRVAEIGSDGKLLHDALGNTHQVTLGEKLLLPALVKMTNFVPEGGIWLNTQRPEWNDANNALVGNGLSMVTVCYLRRYFSFMSNWFSTLPLSDTIRVSREVVLLLKRMLHILQEHELSLGKQLNDVQRRQIVDSLSNIGAAYRKSLYKVGLSGAKEELPLTAFVEFFEQSLHFLDHTIKANRRDDGMYHAYNLLTLKTNEAGIDHLYEMLEGQVAVLSSAALTPEETVEVLEALRNSAMYRDDQQSYMLYPDRELPRFVDKNLIDQKWIEQSTLVKRLIELNDSSFVRTDILGELHFNGQFRNSDDLNRSLDELEKQDEFTELVREERQLLNQIYEDTFQHRGFTGRSGTFFGYEGLGSIYWHMVSKLCLAAIENLVWANEDPATEPATLRRLRELYREIREGIGVNKPPSVYGAFPTDPYSHTPWHAGVQQPGMTGQVKEDILTRFIELGVRIENGTLRFDPKFFESNELVSESSNFDFVNIEGRNETIELSEGSFGFTLCQVPIIYRKSETSKIVVHSKVGEIVSRHELTLSESETAEVFTRSGAVTKIELFFKPRNDNVD